MAKKKKSGKPDNALESGAKKQIPDTIPESDQPLIDLIVDIIVTSIVKEETENNVLTHRDIDEPKQE